MSDASAGATQTDESGIVRLEIPASTEHLRLVRLLVSSVATAHGADLEDLEDLRLAAGEVCAHAISAAGAHDRMSVSAAVSPGVDDAALLTVRASVDSAIDPGPLDELSSMVLEAAADRHGVDADAGSASAWFSRTVRSVGSAEQPVD